MYSEGLTLSTNAHHQNDDNQDHQETNPTGNSCYQHDVLVTAAVTFILNCGYQLLELWVYMFFKSVKHLDI